MFTTSKEGNWLVLELEEKLARLEALDLSGLIKKESNQGNKNFLLDAANLLVIDSFAIGILIRTLRDLRELGGDICIRGLQGDSLEVFKRSGLNSLFMIKEGKLTYAAKERLFVDDYGDFALDTTGPIAVFHFLMPMDNNNSIRRFKGKALTVLAERTKILLDFKNIGSFSSEFADEIIHICRILRSSSGEMRICSANAKILRDIEILQPSHHSSTF